MDPQPLVAHAHSRTEHAGVVLVSGAGVGSEGFPLQARDDAITIATPNPARNRRQVFASSLIVSPPAETSAAAIRLAPHNRPHRESRNPASRATDRAVTPSGRGPTRGRPVAVHIGSKTARNRASRMAPRLTRSGSRTPHMPAPRNLPVPDDQTIPWTMARAVDTRNLFGLLRFLNPARPLEGLAPARACHHRGGLAARASPANPLASRCSTRRARPRTGLTE